jgi:hypothetical protein
MGGRETEVTPKHAHACMNGMKAERVDGRTIDQRTADEFAALNNAASAVDSPHLEPIAGEHVRLSLRYAWDGRGRADVLTARTDGGELAAWAELELPHWDNRQMCFAELNLHPTHRESGAAEVVLDEICTLMREQDRTQLITNAWRDSYLEGFWLANGLEVGSRAAQRRLLPPELDWPRLEELHAASLEASASYEVFEVPQPVPDEMIDDLVELEQTMNDAPLEDLVIEDQVWTPERFRQHEQALADRRMRNVCLMARERRTGAPAGFTAVVIEDERTHLGFQEDTAVVRGHRGHRLGLRLKIEMLALLRERDPQLVQIDTWNAESNGYMIGVNDAIGCFVVARGGEFQRTLP